MDSELINKLIPPTISLIVTSLFGLFIGILVEKFKNKIKVITYTIYTQNLKPHSAKNLLGNISITLNERIIDNLRTAYIEFENKNNTDLENVVVKFGLSQGGIFQGSEGYLRESNSWLQWTEKHNDYFHNVLEDYNSSSTNSNGLKDISDELQQRITFVNQNQEYLIPVFNRKESAHFNFLFEEPLDGTEAYIYTSIVHKSVKLERKIDDEKAEKRNLWIGITIGTIVVIILLSILTFNYEQQRWLIIIAGIIGFSYSIVGFFILAVYKKIRAFFR